MYNSSNIELIYECKIVCISILDITINMIASFFA